MIGRRASTACLPALSRAGAAALARPWPHLKLPESRRSSKNLEVSKKSLQGPWDCRWLFSLPGVEEAVNVPRGVGGPLARTLQLHKDWAGSSKLEAEDLT